VAIFNQTFAKQTVSTAQIDGSLLKAVSPPTVFRV
jgi:hypothetical protein